MLPNIPALRSRAKLDGDDVNQFNRGKTEVNRTQQESSATCWIKSFQSDCGDSRHLPHSRHRHALTHSEHQAILVRLRVCVEVRFWQLPNLKQINPQTNTL
jgi:hypothetical protein